MPDYRKPDQATTRLFEAVIAKFGSRLQASSRKPELGLWLLKRFDEVKRYDSLFVHCVTELKGKKQSFFVLLVEKHSTIVVQKRHTRDAKEIQEIEPMLIFDIPDEMGRAFIRKETLGDKIADVFLRVDIDFAEYPGFSNKYFVAGENPELVKKNMPRRLLESLSQVGEMIVEINGNKGLLRPEKNLTEELLTSIINIGSNIAG